MPEPIESKSKESIKALYEVVLSTESKKKYPLAVLKKMSAQFEKTFKPDNNLDSPEINTTLSNISKEHLSIYAEYAKFLGFTESETNIVAKIIASAKAETEKT